ncbi:MAG: hypothetical protein SGPRY_005650 [Prymnesium sp.]
MLCRLSRYLGRPGDEASLAARAALREAGARHPSERDGELRKLVALFETSERKGLAVRDRGTMHALISVLCSAGTTWEPRERARALRLFEDTQVRRASEGEGRADLDWERSQSPDRREEHILRQLPSLEGIEWDVASGAARDSGCGEVRIGGECEEEGCSEVPRYGDAANGFARACKQHKREGEERVDFTTEALYALADSCTEIEPRLLKTAAQIYMYIFSSSQRVFFLKGFDRSKVINPQARLSLYFKACAREREFPKEASLLLPHVISMAQKDSSRKMHVVNTYIHACARANDHAAAWAAFTAAERGGLAPDVVTLNSLAMASSERAQLIDAVEQMLDRNPMALRNAHVVTSIVHAHAKLRQPERADEVYARAIDQGLERTVPLLVARCFAFAVNARLAQAILAFQEARQLLLEQRERAAKAEDQQSLDSLSHSEHIAVAVLLSTFVAAGQPADAFSMFESLRADGFEPRQPNAIAPLIHAASQMRDVERALAIYQAAEESGIAPDWRMLYAAVTALTGHPVNYGKLSGGRRREQWQKIMQSSATEMDEQAALAGRWQELEAREHVESSHVDEAIRLCWRAHKRSRRLFRRGTLMALLGAAERTRQPRHADEAVRLAHAHGIDFQCEQRNLLLAARLAAIPRRHGDGDGQLKQALAMYFRGRALGWQWRPDTISFLLRVCIQNRHLEEATELVGHIQEFGFQPKMKDFNDLMRLSYELGEIDSEAWRLWKQGMHGG